MRSCSFSAAGVCATVRFGLAGLADGAAVCKRPISPQAASASARHNSPGAAQRRLIPHLRRPTNPSTSATLNLYLYELRNLHE